MGRRKRSKGAKTTGATRESTKAPTGESTMAPTGNHTYYCVRLMPVILKQQNRLADTITPLPSVH